MTRRPPLSPVADPAREMPEAPGARLDRVEAAIESLRSEQRRLARMGLAPALRACREQLRYWEFVRAVLILPRRPRSSRRLAA